MSPVTSARITVRRSPKRARYDQEVAVILALPISEASVKARSGPPDDDDSPDTARDVWSGVIPSSPATASRNLPRPSPWNQHVAEC